MSLEKPDYKLPTTVQLPTDKAKALNNCQLTTEDIDRLLTAVSDLTSPDFHAWYCKQAYKLGPTEFLARADRARTGNNPPRLFSALLRA